MKFYGDKSSEISLSEVKVNQINKKNKKKYQNTNVNKIIQEDNNIKNKLNDLNVFDKEIIQDNNLSSLDYQKNYKQIDNIKNKNSNYNLTDKTEISNKVCSELDIKQFEPSFSSLKLIK